MITKRTAIPGSNEPRPSASVVAIGSNLGDRRYNLLHGVQALRGAMTIVRVSAIRETAPIDAPPGSPAFLNMVVVGWTRLGPEALLTELLAIERRLGRAPRRVRNEPRVIDLDLIAYGAVRMRTRMLTLPHPRARARAFVMEPLTECSPATARFILRATGTTS